MSKYIVIGYFLCLYLLILILGGCAALQEMSEDYDMYMQDDQVKDITESAGSVITEMGVKLIGGSLGSKVGAIAGLFGAIGTGFLLGKRKR